jgi:hypothetical protein
MFFFEKVSAMQSAMLSLFLLQKHCDVQFITTDESPVLIGAPPILIGAHKAILSACSYVLDAMLEDAKDGQPIEIDAGFHHFLHCMYEGSDQTLTNQELAKVKTLQKHKETNMCVGVFFSAQV